MSNQRVFLQPGPSDDRTLTAAQHLERALDEWYDGGLDTSADIAALEQFSAKWKTTAMLIALRAMRRIEDLRLVQQVSDANAAAATSDTPDAKRYTTAENYERALDDWADSGLDTSLNPNEFAAFATKWRLTATLISLRAERRADQLRAVEAVEREREVRVLLVAQEQAGAAASRQAAAEAEREEQALMAQRAAAAAAQEPSAPVREYERALGEWSSGNGDKAQKVDELVSFATKWRQDSTLVSLRAERRVDHLKALEFEARGGRQRKGTAADRRQPELNLEYAPDAGMAGAAAQAAAAAAAYDAFDDAAPVPAARPLIERSYSVSENFNRALDDWQDNGLDDSHDFEAFAAFVQRWKNDATLIALRAERRIDALRKQQAGAALLARDVQLADQLSEQDWDAVVALDTRESYLGYIERNPHGRHLDAARACLSTLESPVALEEVAPERSPTTPGGIAEALADWDRLALDVSEQAEDFAQFADRWSKDAPLIALRASRRHGELQTELRQQEIDWDSAAGLNTAGAYQRHLAAYPDTSRRAEIADRLLALDEGHVWARTAAAGTAEAYRAYLASWPGGTYASQARLGLMGGGLPATIVATVGASQATPDDGTVVAPAAGGGAPLAVEDTPPQAKPLVAARAPRRAALTWFAVLGFAAAGACLAYYYLPSESGGAGTRAGQQSSVGGPAALPASNIGRGKVALAPEVLAPNLRAPPGGAGREPVGVPATVPDRGAAKGRTASFAAPNSQRTGVSPAVAPHADWRVRLAPSDDSNVVTAAHAGWSVRLAPSNSSNVATAAHAGWSVRLSPANEWSFAIAPHAAWPIPVAPADEWNGPTAPHVLWTERLAALSDANSAVGAHLGWLERLAAENEANGPVGAHAGWPLRLPAAGEYDVAAAPHLGWAVRLAERNDWNGATAAQAGWKSLLPPPGEWDIAGLPHMNWPERLVARNVWNRSPVAPHRGGREYLAAASDGNAATGPHMAWALPLRSRNAWNKPVAPHKVWPERFDLVAQTGGDTAEPGVRVERDVAPRSLESTDGRLVSPVAVARSASGDAPGGQASPENPSGSVLAATDRTVTGSVAQNAGPVVPKRAAKPRAVAPPSQSARSRAAGQDKADAAEAESPAPVARVRAPRRVVEEEAPPPPPRRARVAPPPAEPEPKARPVRQAAPAREAAQASAPPPKRSPTAAAAAPAGGGGRWIRDVFEGRN
jgi:hypothetical protein